MSSDRQAVVKLRDTERSELARICEMEQGDARPFIVPYTLERHLAEFARPGVRYKSVFCGDQLVGFLILVLDDDGRSVEFRRIVIASPGRGIGAQAVRLVDQVCRAELGRDRIWLDVFKTNSRARRVYERCGYRPSGETKFEGRTLIIYEKSL